MADGSINSVDRSVGHLVSRAACKLYVGWGFVFYTPLRTGVIVVGGRQLLPLVCGILVFC